MQAKRLVQVMIAAVLVMFSSSGFSEEIYTDFFSDKALSGYDTVAYFTQGKPVKGKKENTVQYLGADWFFSSAKNKTLFEENPNKYRPQYGGHCAWAVAVNAAKAKGNPKHWKIVEDRLYLNYSADVQQKWLQDVPGFIVTADKNWPLMLAN